MLALTVTFTLLAVLAAAAPAPAVRDNTPLAGPELTHWPESARCALDRMIATHANKDNYAVFDMDNTSYRFDLQQSLMPFLEGKGILTRDTVDPSLLLIPFKDPKESLYAYYYRMCEVDDNLCYWFSAAVWSGIPLKELKCQVDELMALNTTIKTNKYIDDVLTDVEVSPPRVFTGQVELFNRLMANGIRVYIVSAAGEELVRMVASDPKYGYNVPPERVIGVSLMLNNSRGDYTSARKQIAEGTYDAEANGDYVLTPVLWAPATWMMGKWAGILTYIDEWKLPVLAGGDTPISDGPMFFHGIDRMDGVKLFINKSQSNMEEIAEMNATFSADQAKEGRPVTADIGWVIVKQEDIL